LEYNVRAQHILDAGGHSCGFMLQAVIAMAVQQSQAWRRRHNCKPTTAATCTATTTQVKRWLMFQTSWPDYNAGVVC
jgi:hypothetical protein